MSITSNTLTTIVPILPKLKFQKAQELKIRLFSSYVKGFLPEVSFLLPHKQDNPRSNNHKLWICQYLLDWTKNMRMERIRLKNDCNDIDNKDKDWPLL